MGNRQEESYVHFGLNCAHLLRHSYGPADARCSVLIELYSGSEWQWLNSPTPVPLKWAAETLRIPVPQLVDEAKSGRRKYNYPKNVARRVLVSGATDPKWVTEREAVKKLNISQEQLRKKIDAGEVEAQFLTEHMRIVLEAKWDYERCPLFETGGVCLCFQPRPGPQIKCLMEGSEKVYGEDSGLLF